MIHKGLSEKMFAQGMARKFSRCNEKAISSRRERWLLLDPDLLQLAVPEAFVHIRGLDQVPPSVALDDAGANLAFCFFQGEDGADDATGFGELLLGIEYVHTSPL